MSCVTLGCDLLPVLQSRSALFRRQNTNFNIFTWCRDASGVGMSCSWSIVPNTLPALIECSLRNYRRAFLFYPAVDGAK